MATIAATLGMRISFEKCTGLGEKTGQLIIEVIPEKIIDEFTESSKKVGLDQF